MCEFVHVNTLVRVCKLCVRVVWVTTVSVLCIFGCACLVVCVYVSVYVCVRVCVCTCEYLRESVCVVRVCGCG